MAVCSPRFLELCAGVGGLGLGVHIAEPRSRCVAYIEREAYAASVLVARMESGELDSAPVWSELATFDGRPWRGLVDCVVSGDPCTPNSIAGRQAGADDDRFLVEQVLRVFAECGATRLFRENVTGNADGQLAALVPALESMGCTVAAGIFAASEVGASHRRERLFVMADRDPGPVDNPDCRRHDDPGEAVRAGRGGAIASGVGHDQLADGQAEGRGAGIGGTQKGTWPVGIGWRRPASCGAAMADYHGARGKAWESNPPPGQEGDSKIPVDSNGREFPFAPAPNASSWPDLLERSPGLEPAVLRMANGVAHRVDRLRAIGNGAVPLVAAYAWRSLAALLAEGRGATALVLEGPAG